MFSKIYLNKNNNNIKNVSKTIKIIHKIKFYIIGITKNHAYPVIHNP